MTTRKVDIEESMRDNREACSWCDLENECEVQCVRCEVPLCRKCARVTDDDRLLCPD